MNTEQQAELARKISDKMLRNSTVIGSHYPCRLRTDIQRAVPGAILTLVGQADSITLATDAQIGEAYKTAVNAGLDNDVFYMRRATHEEMGAWLRAAYAEFSEPDVAPDGYPTSRHFGSLGHNDEEVSLRAWADNDVDDVKDGVDEQMAYFADVPGMYRHVPRDGCQATGESKDYLGAVMRYKKARLAAREAVLDLDAPLVPVEGMRLKVDADMNRGAYFAIGDIVEVIGIATDGFYDASWREGPGVAKTQSMYQSALKQRHLVQSLDAPGFLTECPAVGTRFKVTSYSKESAYRLEVGEIVTVTEQSGSDSAYVWGRKADAGERLGSGCWVRWTRIHSDDIDWVEPVVTEEVVAEAEVVPASVMSDILALREEVRVARQAHIDDIQSIGERLIAESKSRSWCSEYDQIISELNRTLNISLPDREQDVEVTVSGTITVPFSVSVTVSRTSDMDDDDVETDALEQVENNFSARELVNSYSDYYGAEVDDGIEVSID